MVPTISSFTIDLLPHEVHDADERGLKLTLAVYESTEHLFTADIETLKSFFELLESRKFDFLNIFLKNELFYALLLKIMVKRLCSPSEHSDDFVAHEKHGVLDRNIHTKVTFWSLMKSPSITFVIL